MSVRSTDNACAPLRRRDRNCLARVGAGSCCLGLAGRRAGPAPVLPRRRPLRGRPTSRSRHRGRHCDRDQGAGFRAGHIRRSGPDTRLDRHHHDGGRPQGVAHTRRPGACTAWCARRGGRRRGGERRVRRSGAQRPVRPSRRPCGRERNLRRSADVASHARHAFVSRRPSVDSAGIAGPRAEPSASVADGLTCAAPGSEPARAYA